MNSQANGLFVTTRWSLVTKAGYGSDEERQRALAQLCEDYRMPLLNFLRRQYSLSREDAEDIVQGFLIKLAAGPMVARVDREKGSFRTFLIGCIKDAHFSELRKAGAQKRGGGILHEVIGQLDPKLTHILTQYFIGQYNIVIL